MLQKKNTTTSRLGWARAELLPVFRLYCHTPFGRLHSRNPEIIELSASIGRTPAAVAMKACNFASLDPTQRARNISALGNASRADRELWAEFTANPEQLAMECERAFAASIAKERKLLTLQWEVVLPTTPTEVKRLTPIRLIQTFFRQTVLASYDFRCAISRIRLPELLNASHIIPWCDDVNRRADPRNGIALNTLYDRAFDRGLITFNESFEIVVSSRLRISKPPPLMKSCLLDIAGKRLELPQRFAPDPACLAYHREHIFIQ